MKNKVNIGKLIREKYKDNTLELPDLFEEIDLVLKEVYQNYSYKHNLTDIQPVGETRDIAKHINGNAISSNGKESAPRHEISTDINGNIKGYNPVVGPAIYAEADTVNPSANAAKTVSVAVPDIFSLITNQRMFIDDDDRKDINDIVTNILKNNKKKYWADRIKSFNVYLQQQKEGKEIKDFRTAISRLIFLSLLKKLSFMTAQPGKLFEYVLAPLIGRQASVVGGGTGKEIIDVFRDNTGYPYSLKMFTGESSDYELKGSRDNLFKYFKGEEQEKLSKTIAKSRRSSGVMRTHTVKEAITYILCVANQQNRTISFCELLVAVNAEFLKNEGFVQVISTNKDGSILRRENDGSYAFLVFPSQNETEISSVEEPQQSQQPEVSRQKYNFLGKDIQQPVNDNFINQFIKTIEQITDPSQIFNLIKQFPDLKRIALDTRRQLNISHEIPPQRSAEYVNAVKQNLLQYIKTNAQQLKTPLQEDEEKTKKDKMPPFSMKFKNKWVEMAQITIELGDPELYNQWQINIANDIQESMSNVLNSFNSLNKNITLYFGTSTKQQDTRRKEKGIGEGTYAQACVDDAQNIVDGVTHIATSEGETIKTTK